MTTADLIEHILRSFDEVLFPALTAYAVWLLRQWVQPKK